MNFFWALLVFMGCAPIAMAAKYPAKVVLIGIDGVSLNLLEPYIEQGITPHLGRIAKQGARGHLHSLWPLRTPQVWTSVVTGKLPGQHGIWDHLSNTYFNPPGVRTQQKRRVTSNERKSTALWTLLGRAGIKTLTVGWMASWPAESVPHGVMVAPIELMGDKRQTSIKGSFYRGAENLVTPASFATKIDSWITNPSDITTAMLRPFADIPPEHSSIYKLPYMKRYIYGLHWSLARARSVEKITLSLLPETKPEVVLAYFQCPDSLLHRFWVFHKSVQSIRVRLQTHGLPTQDAKELHQRFGRIVQACYADVDRRVGRLLDATQGPNTVTFIVSDHGFGHAPVPHKMKDEPYSGDHLDDGILLAQGPNIKPGSRADGHSILDITPTILHLLQQPVAKDMRGKPIDAFFNKGGKPVHWVDSYETIPQVEAAYPSGWPPRKTPRRGAADNKGASLQ